MNTLQTIPNKLPGAAGEIETFAMANCLMLLNSQQNAAAAAAAVSSSFHGGDEDFGRSYPCKTCGKRFPSFQALGGHRASHKKIKLPSEVSGEVLNLPVKAKVHACSICGVEFPIGQALGGHMRRHRGLSGGGNGGGSTVVSSVTTEEGSSGNSSDENNNNLDSENKKRKMINDVIVPVLKKSSISSNTKRVCLDLDLNLTLWFKTDEKDEEKEDDEETLVNGEDDNEVEEGEIVESVNVKKLIEEEKDVEDFLRLELRLPSYNNDR